MMIVVIPPSKTPMPIEMNVRPIWYGSNEYGGCMKMKGKAAKNRKRTAKAKPV